MPRLTENTRPVSPKHRWRCQDRVTLTLLDCVFNNHVVEATAIFNHINSKILSREGFSSGLPASSVTAQYHEYKKGGTGSSQYEEINKISLQRIRSVFRSELRTIESAARVLSIPLLLKSANQPQRQPVINSKFNIGESSDTTITLYVPESSDEEEENYLYTPSRLQRRPAIRSGSRLEKFLSVMNYDKGQKKPRFLFRAYEVKYGLKARRFSESNTIPKPPQFIARDFKRQVRPHLDRDKTYKSPFISFAQNPAVSLKHTFIKTAECVEMAFAIIRYDDLKYEAVRRYGTDDDNGPYLVPTICKQHDLWDLPGTYTGAGEFLVWGSVECEPVATIQGAEALIIRGILRTIQKVDYDTGVRLAKYLPRMDNETRELFLYQLVKGFKVPGRHLARTSQSWLDFVRGASNVSRVEEARVEQIGIIHNEPIVISDSEDEISYCEPYVCADDWRDDTE